MMPTPNVTLNKLKFTLYMYILKQTNKHIVYLLFKSTFKLRNFVVQLAAL